MSKLYHEVGDVVYNQQYVDMLQKHIEDLKEENEQLKKDLAIAAVSVGTVMKQSQWVEELKQDINDLREEMIHRIDNHVECYHSDND